MLTLGVFAASQFQCRNGTLQIVKILHVRMYMVNTSAVAVENFRLHVRRGRLSKYIH